MITKPIKTANKAPLRKGFTYPINTKDVSEALIGIPQYSELSAFYCSKDLWPLGGYSTKNMLVKWNGDLTGLVPINHLLLVNYSKTLDRWDINIWSVSTTERLPVRSFLLNTGFPLIKAWLMKERSETWRDGDSSFHIGLIMESNKYTVKETFNNQQIYTHIDTI